LAIPSPSAKIDRWRWLCNGRLHAGAFAVEFGLEFGVEFDFGFAPSF
jgi:hypothetical protein